MKLFGLEISVRKADSGVPVRSYRSSWWPWIREPYSGAWQKDIAWTAETVLAHHAVYACITLISSDIGKLRMRLVEQDKNGIWTETTNPAFSPVLRRPNGFQNHIQFKEWWITSKLIHGNAYALKERDNRGVVVALYLLDPARVTVLVAPDGAVFYKLSADHLAGLPDSVEIPASEIMHDRMNCLFHPLVGVSPIYASGSAANTGQQIISNQAAFFGKGSNPSGTLEAPGNITQEQADELSVRWNQAYSGEGSGKVAVLGNGLKFSPMRMNAVDSQLIEQLKWSAETVASTFHVPAFKIGVGTMPTYSNGEILDQRYYSDCLQSHIEHFETVIDEGLGLGKDMGVELDLGGLLRMDTATQFKTLTDGIGGALLTPNEARKRIDLAPLDGGDTVYMQQQNFSLSALDERDRSDPFAKPEPAPAAPPQLPPPTDTPPPPPPEKAITPGYLRGIVASALLSKAAA